MLVFVYLLLSIIYRIIFLAAVVMWIHGIRFQVPKSKYMILVLEVTKGRLLYLGRLIKPWQHRVFFKLSSNRAKLCRQPEVEYLPFQLMVIWVMVHLLKPQTDCHQLGYPRSYWCCFILLMFRYIYNLLWVKPRIYSIANREKSVRL